MAVPITFRPQARRDLLDLPQQIQVRIIQQLEKLAADPAAAGLQRLKGPWRSFSKLRGGDYRVILRLENDRLQVATLGHRSSVSDRLGRLDPEREQ